MLNLKIEFKIYTFCTVFFFLILLLKLFHPVTTTDELSNHIKNCCNAGKSLAKKQNNCENYEHDILSISPLWRGLCHSTYAVCCSHALEKIFCIAGRLAALTGSRCSEKYNITSYRDCCRACEIGLAVKASGNQCNDTIFNYFADIESYRICCGNGVGSNRNDFKTIETLKKNSTKTLIQTDGGHIETNLQENTDGTIILKDDDDDICGKFPLCEQICENTKESYVCKCHPGFKLSDNMVTCIPILEEANSGKQYVISDSATNDTNVAELYTDTLKNRGDTETDDDIDIDSEDELDDKLEDIITGITCPKGFSVDPIKPSKCVDINECLHKLHNNCKSEETCVNFNGGYRCVTIVSKTCDFGFAFNKDTNICEGDSGYPLRPRLMTPYRSPTREDERNFNYIHAEARNCIERLNEVLKSVFRCLQVGLHTTPQAA